MSDNTLLMH